MDTENSGIARSALTVARVLVVVAFGSLGLQSLVTSAPVPGIEPMPAGMPAARLLSIVFAIGLMAPAITLLIRRFEHMAALATAAVLLLWMLALHGPLIAANPRSGSAWTVFLETAALAAVALMLAGWTPARFLFAACLPGFGLLHWVYAAFVATIIPSFFPARLFLAYATGAGFIAAGIALATGVMARAAMYALACMFGIWVIVLHTPRAIATPNRNEWASLLIAVAMCGGALLAGGASARRKAG